MKNLSRTLAASMATVALLALAGCSDDAPEANTPPSETPSATNSPVADPTETEGTDENVPVPTIGVDPETGNMKWCDPKDQVPFTGEAAAEFGADSVMAAYCQMVDVEMEHSFIDSLMRADSGFTAQDFSPVEVRDMMLPGMQKVYDDAVAAVVAGNATDQQRGVVRGFFAYYTHNGSGYTLDTPAVYNLSFTPASTKVDVQEGQKYLILDFDVKADFALVRDSDGKEFGQSYTKELTFRLEQGTKNSTFPWFVEGYSVKTVYGDAGPRAEVIEGYDKN